MTPLPLLLQCLCNCLLFLCILQSCLYSFNIVLLFLHTSVWHNYTKAPALLFYLILILIDLSKLVYSRVSVFFFISMPNKFSKKFFLLHDNLVLIPNSFFLFLSLGVYVCMFSQIFYGFTKNLIIYPLEKIFFKIIFCFFFLGLCSYQCRILTKLFD